MLLLNNNNIIPIYSPLNLKKENNEYRQILLLELAILISFALKHSAGRL